MISESDFWSSWRERRRALANIPPTLVMVWRSGPGIVATSLLLRISAALIPVAMLYVTKLIVDAVASGASGHPLRPGFWWLVALEFGFAIVDSVITHGVAYCDTVFAERFNRHVSLRVMDHASKLDLESYENPEFHDKLERARLQASDRVGMIRELGRMLQMTITVVGLAAGLMSFSPWLLFLLVACLLPAFLGESHFAFLGYALSFSQTGVRRAMDYYRTLGSSKESAKEMKLYNLSSFFVGRFRELSNQIYLANRDLAGRRLKVNAVLSLLSAAGYYGAYTFVIWRAVSGGISIGTMTFLAGAIAGASTNIQSIFQTFSGIADQALFLTDLQELLKTKPKIRNAAGAIPVPRPIQEGIEFRDVSFKYAGKSTYVLDHLNLKWRPGERLALIGANGQGKTTIVKLLTRLYDPTEGQILLDGVDLREYDLTDLSEQMAAIMQDFVRYEMTAAENVGVGRIEERNDSDRLVGAAQKSLADEVIERLPLGYGQMLGRKFQGGVDLSGGEWQRIALARAYMRDAQMLILDEPTAALDARAEHEVFEKFDELTEGKMALFISHRFSTVRMADRIVVLENGHVTEEGDHVGLMRLHKRYFEMFELQAASYR
jgi:ATP-binding cassette subfamily B protein